MDKLGELIPNLFYDLIARICPGILFSAFISLDSRFQFLKLSQVQPTILVVLFFVGSYIIGFLIDIVAESAAYSVNLAICYSIRHFIKKDVWTLDTWEVMAKYDYQEDSRYTLFIRKCLAELALFRSLFFAWLLLWLFQASLLNSISSFQRLLVFAILGFAVFRRELSTRRVTQRFLDLKQESRKNYMIGKFG